MRSRWFVGVVAVLCSLALWEAAAAGAGARTSRARSALPQPVDSRPPVVVGATGAGRLVGLSFDDGPDPRYTPAILDALRAAGARATFFVTGQAAQAHPALLRRIVAEGSEVANHTHSHRLVEGLSAEDVAVELRAASRAIGAAGVRSRPFFRPPRGRYDDQAVAATTHEGLRVVGWTVCVERWLRNGVEVGVEAAAARVGPGSIVVAHDGGIPDRRATVAALPLLLRRLRAAGHELVPVSELLAAGRPVLGRPGHRDPLPVFPPAPLPSRAAPGKGA